jgi:DNA (cytosine-5)-methyltransferase 1
MVEVSVLPLSDEPRGRPVAIDLFSGAGGLSLGLEQAGFDVLAAVDSDPVHALVYAHNLPRTPVLCQNIESLGADDLRAAAQVGAAALGRPWADDLDCVAGGPSCQGFSVIGSRDPADARNSLVFEFARLVAELHPRYFILENVPGLLSAPYRPMLDRLMAMLREAGYDLGDSPWKLDAYDFQVPQHRRRLFLVGSRNGLVAPRLPAQSAHVTVGDAIGDLMAISRIPASTAIDGIELSPDELEAMDAAATTFVRGLRGARDPDDRSARRRWDPTFMTGVAGTLHSEAVRKRLAAMPLGERDPISRLPKLDPTKPSPTLRAGTGREHGSHTSVRPVHYASPRVVTVREAARLHAFPDWFRFHATRWHALRQIGNSVPPPLARAIGSSIVSALGAQPHRRLIVSMGDPSRLELSLEEAARILDVPRSQLPPPRRRAA